MSRGDLEHALNDERTALTFAPDAPGLLLQMAYIRLRRSEYKQALEYLERAKRFAPDNPEVAKLTGWSFYGSNKMDQAVAEWKRSLALRPIQRCRRRSKGPAGQAGRRKLQGKRKQPLQVALQRYGGAGAGAGCAANSGDAFLCHRIGVELHAAGIDRRDLVHAGGLYGHHKAPSWAGALYDGRIRVPVQGLTAVDQDLSRSLSTSSPIASSRRRRTQLAWI